MSGWLLLQPAFYPHWRVAARGLKFSFCQSGNSRAYVTAVPGAYLGGGTLGASFRGDMCTVDAESTLLPRSAPWMEASFRLLRPKKGQQKFSPKNFPKQDTKN